MVRARVRFSCRAMVVLGLVLIVSAEPPTARGADPLTEQELAGQRDPSFASVSSHYPAMRFPREAIGVKEHCDEFIVLPDGRINFTPVRLEYHWRGGGPPRTGHAYFTLGESDSVLGNGTKGATPRKRLLDGYLPIVVADCTDQDLTFEQTSLAWSHGMSPDEPIWAYVCLKVRNSGASDREVRLCWRTDQGRKQDRKTRTVACWSLKLAAGAEHRVYGKLPFLNGHEKAVESSAKEFQSRLAEVSAFWKQLLNQGMQIRVPEQRVNDAYRAWLAYTFLNVDKIDGRYEPHDGSGFYERVFGIMAAKYCNALGLAGHPDEARKYLDSLQTFISPEGLFFASFGCVDTGALLLVMEQHYQLTGDEQWLRKVAPNIIKMCNWIINKRKQVKAEQTPAEPWYGLIAFNVGVDNPGADYSYVTDTSLCVGMEAAVRALQALGMTKEAARIRQESVAYRQDIERSMQQSVIERAGVKILPVMPKTHKYLKRAAYSPGGKKIAEPGQDCSGHGYYSLFASIVLETKFLPATDERFRLLPELLERRDGLLLGMCAFGARGGIDHAFTYGYWMNCLERNEVRRVLLGFYGSLAYGMSRDTWAGVECTNVVTGTNARTLPHLRSGTQQLRLLRHMLVREQGGTLILGQAVPQHWLTTGKQVAVLRAPTHFGAVSYTVDSHIDQGRILVKLEPPRRSPPDAIVLHLRHPEGAKIHSVSVDGKPLTAFANGAITMRGLGRPVQVEVRYR